MIFSSSDILSQSQLKRLSDHRYNSTGCTLLDPVMQPFWNWLVRKLPLWFAPNAMTVIGLLVNIIASIILMYYSPDACQEAPRWVFAVSAVALFVYQTLDACDGKQARRTNSSSPLGELFDHGCDSISTVFLAISVCISVQLGTYPWWMFFQCFVAVTLFYCAHWQTYVSGTLRFGKFDVTEVQFVIIIIFLISAVCGSSIWSTQLPSLYIQLKLLPIFAGVVTASIAFYANFTVIFTGGVGKNGSTVAGTSILSPLIPIGLVIMSAFIIYQKSTIDIYENHPCLYILAFGLVAAKVTNRLVVAHMTKSEIDYLDSIFVGPGMLFMNQYFNTFVNEYIVLWLCLVYSVADFLHYSAIVFNQICNYLHIHLFTISPVQLSSSMSSTAAPPDCAPLLKASSNDESFEASIINMDPL